MGYGFYLKKNRRKFRKIKVQPTTSIKPVYRYSNKKAVAKRGPRSTFTQRVNQIISRNVENKFTDTIKYNDAVSRSVSGVYTFFAWTPGADATGSKLFNLDIGARQNSRIGNTIKLKRWIIKGLIQPVISTVTTMPNSFVGYVDIYFGKLLRNTSPPLNTLVDLYQNGSDASAPTCSSTDMLNPLNKDKYKVYYHKRFKMGAASDSSTYTSTDNPTYPANNDFKLSQTFGFDVCKYILKNKSLKFDDFSSTTTLLAPDNPDIRNLTLWATFTPQSGQAISAIGTVKTLYNLDCLTYAEYEDA